MSMKHTTRVFDDNKPFAILGFLSYVLVSVAMQDPTYSVPEICAKEDSVGNKIIKTKHKDANILQNNQI